MEFGTTPEPQGSPEIDDATRFEATTRQHTVVPLHTDVAADELPDEQVVTQHIVSAPLANIPSDQEATEPYVSATVPQTPPTSRRHFTHVTLIVALIALAAIAIFAVLRFLA